MRKLRTDEMGRMDPHTYATAPKRPLILVADNVRSMHNIGAFFRTADAFALQGLVLCGISAVPPHRDIYKTALGAENTVPWSYEKDIELAIQSLKNQGYTIAVLEQTDSSIQLDLWQPGGPVALVVGHEVEGVGQAALALADVALEIPQYGTKHSLNVSVATGIALYELCKHIPL